MINYQNGKIYTIKSFQTDKVYYGSTTQSLSKRLRKHKQHYTYYLKSNKGYMTSYEVLAFDDAYISLIEKYPCDSREELLAREHTLLKRINV